MYNFFIILFVKLVQFASLFHTKARLMCQGQRQTAELLRRANLSGQRCIWFHAASLGEFEQGRPLIEKIKAQDPQCKILLTFFSPSGYEVRKNYPLADVVCYLPFDTRRRVREFLDLAQPSVAIFIKYEFWANYLFELKRREIPTYIISAIFRPEQPFFRWYGAPFRALLHCYTHLYIQDDASRQLLEKAGIQGNVTVTGDTRYDRVWEIRRAAKEIPEVESLLQAADGERVRTLVAGSSWPQDEEILIPYFNARPELKLIIAPHEIHEEHLRSIEAMLKRPALRLSAARGKDLRDYSCLIIDCFGLLSSVYRYGEIAYIGGGFGVGIHNTLEAAVYDIPVIFGPEYRKFREACDLVECGGGFAVHSKSEFTAKMDELLSMPDHLRAAGKASGALVRQNIGATEKILEGLPL